MLILKVKVPAIGGTFESRFEEKVWLFSSLVHEPCDECRAHSEVQGGRLQHQAFFLCTPQKNSRTPKLKKSETQENNSKLKQKSSFSGIFGPKFKRYILKNAQLIAKSNSQGKKITHFFQINNVFKLKTQIFQRFPPKTQ